MPTILIPKQADELPPIGKPVFAKLRWFSSDKEVGAYIKRVDEDNCIWRTVDDNSRLNQYLTVIEWYLPVEVPIEIVQQINQYLK